MKHLYCAPASLRRLKQAALAVPAAALMLGQSQAGTSIGINFWGNFYGAYDGGKTITSLAFGLTPANWYTTPSAFDPDAANGNHLAVGPGNALTLTWSAAYTGVSWVDPANAPAVSPGDSQVYYGFLDGGDASYSDPGYSVSLSGLAALFPSGYVVQATASADSGSAFATTTVSDGTTTQHLPNPVAGTTTLGGAYALGQASGLFTGDALSLSAAAATPPQRSTLNGFLVTDQPVVSSRPAGGGAYDPGAQFALQASVVGIPPIAYQWCLNGNPVPGGTNAAYSVAAAAGGDAGVYYLVVTNAYGAATSDVVAVQVPALPVLIREAASLTNYRTMSASLAVRAGGGGPLSYQWSKDGNPLPDGTNASLNFVNLQTADSGAYQLVMTNGLGAVTSSLAYVSVLTNLPPYEGFNYTNGPLLGQGADPAWGGAWSQTSPGYNGQSSAGNPGAGFQDGVNTLLTSGGAALLATTGVTTYENVRPLLATLGGTSGGTVYLSFLGQLTNTSWAGLELVQNGTGALLIGETFFSGDWGWGDRQNTNALNGHSGIDCTTPSLVVCRLDFTTTNTAVRLYVNPALGSEPATPSATGTWTNFQFNAVRLVAHGQYGSGVGPCGVLDEIRFGGSWGAVTPAQLRMVPGPAAVGPSLVWNYGVLQASPALGASAAWTNVANAASPYATQGSGPVMFYRLGSP